MVWLAVLFYWRRALRGWRLGRADYTLRASGLVAPVWVTRPLEQEAQQMTARIAPIRLHLYPDAWTNPHADYFLRNLAAIRAEERLAMRKSRWSRFKRWVRRAS